MPFTKGHKLWDNPNSVKTRFKKGTSVRIGMKHTPESILQISESRKGKCLGKNNPSYKNGMTPLMNKIKRLTIYKKWQKEVLRRDKFICRKCGKDNGDKNPHHLMSLSFLVKLFNIKNVKEAEKHKDLWNIKNGITLCPDCHSKTSNFSWKAAKNPIDTRTYLMLGIFVFALLLLFPFTSSALTFGNSTKGGSSDRIDSASSLRIAASNFQGANTTVTQLTAWFAAGGTEEFKMGIYNYDGSVFLKGTNGVSSPGVGDQELTASLTSNLDITPTTYYLGVSSDSAASTARIYRDTTNNNSIAYFNAGEDYTNLWPASISGTNNNYTHSIYFTYACNTPTASDYSYKKEITIKAGHTSGGYTGGVATTTDGAFVIVATTTDANLAATSSSGRIENVWENDNTDNNNEYPLDIAFFDNDETTPLSFEIESYSSTTGETVFWVEVADGVSSSSDGTIYMYYGYTGGTGYACSQEAWDGADYDPVGVWHLSESPPSTSTDLFAYDSTDNNNDGSFVGSMAAEDQVAGQLDGSLDVDGTDDAAQCGTDFVVPTAGFTVSTWIYSHDPTKSIGYYGQAFIGRAITSGNYQIIMGVGYEDITLLAFENSAIEYIITIGEPIQANTWYHVVGVAGARGSNIASIYIDGVLRSDISGSTNDGDDAGGSVPLNIGKHRVAGTVYNFDGLIDEVRIYNQALTPADITTIYNMEVDQDSFLTWGAEEETTPPPTGETGEVIPMIINFN